MSAEEVMRLALQEIESRIGMEPSTPAVEAPMWEPLPSMPGRGILMPDGRRLSPQQAALECMADELFFGGAPGGGKTMLALGLALTAHRNSIIFRRQYAQLRGAEGIMEKSREVIGDRGHFAGNIWTKLPGQRTLEFGSCQHEWDKEKYKGRAHDLKLFDEIPDFTKTIYRFLIGWLRTSIQGQRTRVVCTGNPPTTEEGQWVIAYWGPWLDPNHPNPAKPGELRWYVVDADGKDVEVAGPEPYLIGGSAECAHQFGARRECPVCGGRMVMPRSRSFIPSHVEDNPFYMATDYTSVLDNLPEPLRSQMRFGNFHAAVGDAERQVIPRAWVQAAQARWRPGVDAYEPMSAAGVDTSRGGQDEFVITKRHGAWVAPQVVHGAKEAKDGAAGAMLVCRALNFRRDVPVQIDVSGESGPSVYDHVGKSVEDGGPAMMAIPLNGSRGTKLRDKTGALRFLNKRAEWHWRFREALEPGSGLEVALPPDPQLLSDLCAPRWEFTLTGHIKIESKDEIKKRIGRSPDRGESCMYSFAQEADGMPSVLFGDKVSTAEVDDLEKRVAQMREELKR